MKLAPARIDVDIVNPVAIHRCKLANESTIVEMLIRAYTNPGKSGVYEPYLNGCDSMVMADKLDVPIKVTLESDANGHMRSQPMLTIQDEGVGMSHEKVIYEFTQIGLSDKTNSDKVTGMLGIGSKAPLAYTDQFFLECFDGTQARMYCVARDATGSVVVLEQGTYECYEPVGVKVSIPLLQADVSTIAEHIIDIAGITGHPNSVYKCKPTLIGFEAYHAPVDVNTLLIPVTDVVYITNTNDYSSRKFANTVLMGNMAYPVALSQIINREPDHEMRKQLFQFVKDYNVCLCVPLGDENGLPYLTFPPSRDAIEITEASTNYILARLREACVKIAEKIRDSVLSHKTFLDACIWAVEQSVYSKNAIAQYASYNDLLLTRSVQGLMKLLELNYGVETNVWDKSNTKKVSRSNYEGSLFARVESLRALKENGCLIVDELHSYKRRVELYADKEPYLYIVAKTPEEVAKAESVLDTLGVPHSRISSLDKYTVTRGKRLYNREGILHYVGAGRNGSPATFSSCRNAHGEPENGLILRMKGWHLEYAKQVLSDGLLSKLRRYSHGSPNKSIFGLRYTDWPDKDLPAGYVGMEDHLASVFSVAKTWGPYIRYARRLKTHLPAYSSLHVLTSFYSHFRLKPATIKYFARLKFWCDMALSMDDLALWFTNIQDIHKDLYGYDDLNAGFSSDELRAATNDVIEAIYARFPMLKFITTSFTTKADIDQLKEYVDNQDKSRSAAILKLSTFRTFPPPIVTPEFQQYSFKNQKAASNTLVFNEAGGIVF